MSVQCSKFMRTLLIDGTVQQWGRNKVNFTCHHLNHLRNKEQSRTDFHSTKHGSLNKCPLSRTVWAGTEFLILGAVDLLDWSTLCMGAGGALLCTWRCLAASLGSTHSTGVTTHSVSRHYQMFPRDQNRPPPPAENHWAGMKWISESCMAFLVDLVLFWAFLASFEILHDCVRTLKR